MESVFLSVSLGPSISCKVELNLWCSCVLFSFFCISLSLSYSQDGSSSQCGSEPPTPSALTPSPASLSSYHGDDSDSISSPAWPKTPSSPVSIAHSVPLMWRCSLMPSAHAVIFAPDSPTVDKCLPRGSESHWSKAVCFIYLFLYLFDFFLSFLL